MHRSAVQRSEQSTIMPTWGYLDFYIREDRCACACVPDVVLYRKNAARDGNVVRIFWFLLRILSLFIPSPLELSLARPQDSRQD